MLGPAWSLRWRAPELALLLAERAGAVAKLAGDGPRRLRAEATVVVASCRIGQRLRVVERAIDAVRLAERQKDGATVAVLRVELAGCARSAGVPLVGAAVLRPVLEAEDVQHTLRADALVQMAGCLAQLTGPGVIDDAYAAADRLYMEDTELEPDNRVLFRALLRSEASGEHRRRGDARSSVQAAQEGADLLSGLSQPSSDSGGASARIALRLVHGLLDLGWEDEAGRVAGAELARPVRAPAAAAIGWLGLAIAVRKHLAAGEPKPALALIRDAAELADRHRLSALRAEALTTLSDVHERVGQLAEALDCLRTAQGVRLRGAREVYAARTKLVGAFGETTSPEEFVRLLGGPTGRTALIGRVEDLNRGPTGEMPGRFGMRHPLSAAAVAGARAAVPGGTGLAASAQGDVTMVLVDVTTPERDASAGGGGQIGEQVVSHVLDRVRDAAPTDARVARVGGAEFAVLLPSTQAGQTDRWVEELRGAMAGVDWSSYTPGLAVNVRVAVAQTSPPRVVEPRAAPDPKPASMFEVPTVPLAATGSGRRAHPDQTLSGSPEAQDVLARALEQWRRTKTTQDARSLEAFLGTPDPAQPGARPPNTRPSTEWPFGTPSPSAERSSAASPGESPGHVVVGHVVAQGPAVESHESGDDGIVVDRTVRRSADEPPTAPYRRRAGGSPADIATACLDRRPGSPDSAARVHRGCRVAAARAAGCAAAGTGTSGVGIAGVPAVRLRHGQDTGHPRPCRRDLVGSECADLGGGHLGRVLEARRTRRTSQTSRGDAGSARRAEAAASSGPRRARSGHVDAWAADVRADDAVAHPDHRFRVGPLPVTVRRLTLHRPDRRPERTGQAQARRRRRRGPLGAQQPRYHGRYGCRWRWPQARQGGPAGRSRAHPGTGTPAHSRLHHRTAARRPVAPQTTQAQRRTAADR